MTFHPYSFQVQLSPLYTHRNCLSQTVLKLRLPSYSRYKRSSPVDIKLTGDENAQQKHFQISLCNI